VFASAFPLLRGAPDLLLFALVVDAMVQNDFMHLNVTWPSRRLEWILVTPRFHRVHHDVGMRHGNYGIRFTFWDRMFGTYVAPVPVLATGVDDKVHPLRMAIGL
jgi:sterol desaturase/sphingolipid hydroxylase (fatty acid hydroxylase superfamily)